MSIQVFSFAVIGGLGSVAGGVSGVAMFRLLDFTIGKYASGGAAAILRLSLTGGGLLLILYFLPGGVWALAQRLRDRWLVAVAGRRSLLVPSLVADQRVPGAEAPGTEPSPLETDGDLLGHDRPGTAPRPDDDRVGVTA